MTYIYGVYVEGLCQHGVRPHLVTAPFSVRNIGKFLKFGLHLVQEKILCTNMAPKF
jgi:hypothetical protein